jgi:hypothetical protein
MRKERTCRANCGFRITRHVPRFTLYLTLLLCLLTTLPGVAGCRSGGIRVRSWDEAIDFVRDELEAAGDLEGRLEGYARRAATLSEQIDAIEQARPALELIGRLRDVQVPLIGDGWQILLALLTLATVDGAKIIGKLEETLRALMELKGSLDNMSGLPPVSDAIRAFRADPSRRTVGALAEASATATPSMRQLHADLGEILAPLSDVAENLSGLLRGLRGAADAGIPVVSDAAREAVEGIGPIEEPLLAVRDGLERLHQDIDADVKILERIQEAVRKAREHEE